MIRSLCLARHRNLATCVAWTSHALEQCDSSKCRYSTNRRTAKVNRQDSGWKTHTGTRINKSETSRNLLNKVSWDVSPEENKAGKKGRWKTKEEIQNCLKGIRTETKRREASQGGDRQIGTTSNFWARVNRKPVNNEMTKPPILVEEHKAIISEYAQMLCAGTNNSSEKCGMLESVLNNSTGNSANHKGLLDSEEPEYKTAVKWLDYLNEKHRNKWPRMPISHYEEMVEWSQEGKLLSFPIDNEVSMAEEHNTPFYKHVFLEDLIEEGFPQHGLIRRFMEVVILGLTKNPYLSAKEKEEHVNWFKDYFNEKMETLKTVGAISDEKHRGGE